MSDYDVVVVGAGPGGYVAAVRAAQLGLKTAIVDKQWLGGVCLNVGCIPSKALLRNADLTYTLKNRAKDFGISYESLTVDYASAVQRSRQVSDRLVRGVGFLMRKNHIDVIMGTARLAGRDRVTVTDTEGKTQELNAKNIIVATGAHAILLPGVAADGQHVLTYLEAITQTHVPESAVIIGGGPIGAEFATVWNAYGSQVTVVEMLPHLLPLEDEEAAGVLAKEFQARGIRILAGTRVESVQTGEKGVTVHVSGEGGEQTLEAEQALIAIGFRPNSEDLGLEELGVAKDARGFITIDDRMATNVPGIWAIGDVTGRLLLAHVASAQGIVCAENIAGVETVTLDYRMMPRAVYSQPQVASFGLSESEAKEQGYEVTVGRFPYQANGKALGLGESAGFVKLVTDNRYGEVLGATLVGPDVSELLPELTLAHNAELTVDDIARNVHAHPTLSEALMEAAENAEGRAIDI